MVEKTYKSDKTKHNNVLSKMYVLKGKKIEK